MSSPEYPAEVKACIQRINRFRKTIGVTASIAVTGNMAAIGLNPQIALVSVGSTIPIQLMLVPTSYRRMRAEYTRLWLAIRRNLSHPSLKHLSKGNAIKVTLTGKLLSVNSTRHLPTPRRGKQAIRKWTYPSGKRGMVFRDLKRKYPAATPRARRAH